MKIKSILYEYFKWYDNMPEEELPQASVEDDSDPLIHVGAVVNSWVKWKPAEKQERYDFKEIEEQLNTEIHSSIKEYYNSYWFYQLIVDYRDFEIEMYRVVPGNYIADFLSRFLEYVTHYPNSIVRTHDLEILMKNLRNYAIENPTSIIRIPIGFDLNTTFLVLVDNATGTVQIEDFENETFEDIADSLYTLLSNGN